MLPGRAHAVTAWPRESADAAAVPRSLGAVASYRIGDGCLHLSAPRGTFLERFDRVFGDCRVEPSGDGDCPLRCEVDDLGDATIVTTVDPRPLDLTTFVTTIFADRHCVVQRTNAGDTVVIGHDADAVHLSGTADRLVFGGPGARDAVIGSLMVQRVLRLQNDVAVLHAGSVAVGTRGLIFVGGKGRGKTTMALALGARGHAVLGDELVGVRLPSRGLVAIRRAVSIRPGPRAASVGRALAEVSPEVVEYPDGSRRVRTSLAKLFPRGTGNAPTLDDVCFLRGFAPRPAVERFAPTPDHLPWLAPLASSMWALPRGVRAFRLLGLLARARCWWVEVADPDETAALLDATITQPCH